MTFMDKLDLLEQELKEMKDAIEDINKDLDTICDDLYGNEIEDIDEIEYTDTEENEVLDEVINNFRQDGVYQIVINIDEDDYEIEIYS